MYLQDGDQVYLIEDNKVVSSMTKEEFEAKKPTEKKSDFKLGDRVSYREQPGNIISVIPSIYGSTYGIRFDDGNINEYSASQLETHESIAPLYSSSITDLMQDYDDYSKLPANTLEELERKEHDGRSLNLRARALVTDHKLALADRIELDRVVTSTGVDVLDFKESRQLLRQAENAEYLSQQPKFKMDEAFGGWGSVARTGDDISWLDAIEVPVIEINETHLASLAQKAAETLTQEQLEDEDFAIEVISFATQTLPREEHARFVDFFTNSRKQRLEEMKEAATQKVASKEEDWDSVDDAALYMN